MNAKKEPGGVTPGTKKSKNSSESISRHRRTTQGPLFSRPHLRGHELYVIAPQNVLRADLSPRELKVYLALASHANEDGEAWPSLGTIAKETGLNDVRAVRRALRDLELVGMISSFRRFRGGNVAALALSSVYRLEPDPNVWVLERQTDDDGPGGFVARVAWSELAALRQEFPCAQIRLRTRADRERFHALDRFSQVTSELSDTTAPADTPGVAVEIIGIPEPQRQEAQSALDALALWCARGSRLLPWSVLVALIEKMNTEDPSSWLGAREQRNAIQARLDHLNGEKSA